jgi:hypothetical protein
MGRVFISSNFLEMVEYRAAAEEIVRLAHHDPVRLEYEGAFRRTRLVRFAAAVAAIVAVAVWRSRVQVPATTAIMVPVPLIEAPKLPGLEPARKTRR